MCIDGCNFGPTIMDGEKVTKREGIKWVYIHSVNIYGTPNILQAPTQVLGNGSKQNRCGFCLFGTYHLLKKTGIKQINSIYVYA